MSVQSTWRMSVTRVPTRRRSERRRRHRERGREDDFPPRDAGRRRRIRCPQRRYRSVTIAPAARATANSCQRRAFGRRVRRRRPSERGERRRSVLAPTSLPARRGGNRRADSRRRAPRAWEARRFPAARGRPPEANTSPAAPSPATAPFAGNVRAARTLPLPRRVADDFPHNLRDEKQAVLLSLSPPWTLGEAPRRDQFASNPNKPRFKSIDTR